MIVVPSVWLKTTNWTNKQNKQVGNTLFPTCLLYTRLRTPAVRDLAGFDWYAWCVSSEWVDNTSIGGEKALTQTKTTFTRSSTRKWEYDNTIPFVIVIVIGCRLGAAFFSQKWHPVFCLFWYNYNRSSPTLPSLCLRSAFAPIVEKNRPYKGAIEGATRIDQRIGKKRMQGYGELSK